MINIFLCVLLLLLGRFLEAYSKGHTADAITALGKLRPATALLLSPQSSPKQLSSPNLSFTETDEHDKTSESVHSQLEKGAPTTISRVAVDLLEVGDVVRVLNGASPPADGTLVDIAGGIASFDESSLTGESRPVKKQVGDQVYVGTINRGGVVDVKVDAIGGQTLFVAS